jgi:hypothetical protein
MTPSVRLSSSCTVAQYRQHIETKDADAIVAFIVERFTERYLRPISASADHKNGFTMMAVSCLMIECLESFRCGWPNTKNRSRATFRSFFSHWKQFENFRHVSDAFYDHVRCGLLHQAETTGGWRIIRRGPLLAERTINATRFVAALGTVLRSYGVELRHSEWDSEVWKNLRKKMDTVCANTMAS